MSSSVWGRGKEYAQNGTHSPSPHNQRFEKEGIKAIHFLLKIPPFLSKSRKKCRKTRIPREEKNNNTRRMRKTQKETFDPFMLSHSPLLCVFFPPLFVQGERVHFEGKREESSGEKTKSVNAPSESHRINTNRKKQNHKTRRKSLRFNCTERGEAGQVMGGGRGFYIMFFLRA